MGASFADNILEVRESSKAFKANSASALLKWQRKSSDDDFLPVTLSCWPSSTADGTQVVLELELTDINATLENVHIRFPAASSAKASISGADIGVANYDAGSGCVHWHIPVLDKSE